MQRWVAEQAAQRPHAPALRCGGERLDYAGMAARVAAAAAMLAARGVGAGDRVAYLGPNHPAQLILLFALARLGAMQVPLNWRLAVPELRFILADSGARLLFAAAAMHATALAAAPPGCGVLDAEAAWPAADAAPPAQGGPEAAVLLVPAVMQALVTHPGWAAADLASLRAVAAGASAVPLPLIAAFHARGIPVQQIYGATETAPIALCQTAAEAWAAPGSIGCPPEGCAARIVDAGGGLVPAGRIGEIEVRGPMLARGYWNAPEATAAAFRDGWFRTGDLGWVDAEGRFWFSDRVSTLIISGGENIAPAEVERVLRTAPGVVEGAVCGRPDPRWGEVPVAVVVLAQGCGPAAVLAHFEGRLARFKHPRAVVVVGALPRTALGKVALPALRRLAEAG